MNEKCYCCGEFFREGPYGLWLECDCGDVLCFECMRCTDHCQCADGPRVDMKPLRMPREEEFPFQF